MASHSESSSPDVDTGWAFVVLLWALVTQVLIYGLSLSNSIFYAIFLDEFEDSPVSTAWAVNMTLFCSLSFGVVGNCLDVMFGHRVTLTIGCFLSTTGIIATSFMNNSIGVLVMFGIVSGTGFAITALPTFLMIPVYFMKYRVIANAIASVGVSLGQFIYAPFIRYLVAEYHWRGAFIILGAVNLNTIVTIAAFMPPRGSKDVAEPSIIRNQELSKDTNNAKVIARKLLMDLLIFRNPLWLLHCLGRVCMYISTGGFFTHIFNFGRQPRLNFTPLQITFLPSIIGIGGVTARLLIGPLTYLLKIHVVLMYMVTNLLIVTASIAVSLTNSYVVIAVCCFLVGVSFGGNSVVFEVIIHIIGIERYGSGLSYSMAFAGIGFLLGGPFAAWVYEVDPSYLWSFRMIAVMMFLAVVLHIPCWLTLVDGKICQRTSTEDLLRKNDMEHSRNEEETLVR